MKTVFRYNIWFDGCDIDDFQTRYVMADTEEEAEAKLENYRSKLVADGFASFTYAGGWVEIDNVK